MFLLFGLSLTVALAQEALLERLRARATTIKRSAGWVLVVVGLWLVALAVWADGFGRLFPV